MNTRTPPVDVARLAAAKVALAEASALVAHLNAASRPADTRRARAAVQDAANRLGNIHGPDNNLTGCTTHPRGPVEPEPQPGETRCWLCNAARRRNNPSQRRPAA